MSLRLHYHPLTSFCHKVLIALCENETAFTPHRVDFFDDVENRAFVEIWPPRTIRGRGPDLDRVGEKYFAVGVGCAHRRSSFQQ